MKWIRVEDELPDEMEMVIGFKDGNYALVFYDPDIDIWENDEYEFEKSDFTHWSYIEPPKNGTKEKP